MGSSGGPSSVGLGPSSPLHSLLEPPAPLVSSPSLVPIMDSLVLL